MLSGALPSALDIPTGLGKTSVMAIWLSARLQGAKLPRRLVYIVDRRVVVDQATREAETLLEQHPALHISTLRGQFADNREWLKDPAAPAIIIGTVDMVGSRLLFSGYGVGRGMRPVHAGMLGQDTLFVLDEAHLVPPFEAMLRAATAENSHLRQANKALPGVWLLTLSATQRSGSGNTFALDAADKAHPVVAQRIGAPKLLTIETVQAKALVAEVIGKLGTLLEDDPSARVVLFCDARKDAVAVEAALIKSKIMEKADRVALLTGARRVHEREDASAQLARLGFTGPRDDKERDPAVLIATSAGEVGVDFDADHTVMDLVPWERMVQRLGRVNRRGAHEGSQVVVLDTGADAAGWAGRSDANPEAVRTLLGHLEKDGAEAFCGPQALRTLNRFKTAIDEASTQAPLHPALDRPTLDAWSLTSLKEHTGRTEIVPWLRGWIEEDRPQCAVIWRQHLPPEGTRETEIEQLFRAATPHLSEKLETEAWQVAEWLAERSRGIGKAAAKAKNVGDVPPVAENGIAAIVLAPDGAVRATMSLDEFRALGEMKNKEREAALPDLSSATLVVSSLVGGLSAQGMLDASIDGPVEQTAEQPKWAERYKIAWRIGFETPKDVASSVEEEDAKGDISCLPKGSGETFRIALKSVNDEVSKWLLVGRVKPGPDEVSGSGHGNYLSLRIHTADVRRETAEICSKLGLSDALTQIFDAAAMMHDRGKVAAVWQRYAWVDHRDVPSGLAPLAKTRRSRHWRTLQNYRHEFGSLLEAARNDAITALPEADRDLALHLIASHHGHARPFIRPDGCESPAEKVEGQALEAALRFARLQEVWGPWGLAWLESILRAADRAASENPSVEDTDG